ncbi:hypothetical protein ACIRPQ_29330 [Streptomyces sp. NPDC101213]|uniref:hypothetical protein n=1 Tax=Streptomyces sp. NPDC101213 TaxID=3366130 RepID=UPI003804AB06
MTRRHKRWAGLLVIAAALAVVVLAGLPGGDSAANLDERSYRSGYGSWAGALFPAADEDRATVEAGCRTWWRDWAVGEEDAGRYDVRSWIVGCADYIEQKDSRF